jgi:hypothetical protein
MNTTTNDLVELDPITDKILPNPDINNLSDKSFYRLDMSRYDIQCNPTYGTVICSYGILDIDYTHLILHQNFIKFARLFADPSGDMYYVANQESLCRHMRECVEEVQAFINKFHSTGYLYICNNFANKCSIETCRYFDNMTNMAINYRLVWLSYVKYPKLQKYYIEKILSKRYRRFKEDEPEIKTTTIGTTQPNTPGNKSSTEEVPIKSIHYTKFYEVDQKDMIVCVTNAMLALEKIITENILLPRKDLKILLKKYVDDQDVSGNKIINPNLYLELD